MCLNQLSSICRSISNGISDKLYYSFVETKWSSTKYGYRLPISEDPSKRIVDLAAAPLRREYLHNGRPATGEGFNPEDEIFGDCLRTQTIYSTTSILRRKPDQQSYYVKDAKEEPVETVEKTVFIYKYPFKLLPKNWRHFAFAESVRAIKLAPLIGGSLLILDQFGTDLNLRIAFVAALACISVSLCAQKISDNRPKGLIVLEKLPNKILGSS